METWWKIYCDCDKVNWVCAGDMDDMTACDVEGYKCWNCCKEHVFDGVEFDEFEDLNIEEGMENPN